MCTPNFPFKLMNISLLFTSLSETIACAGLVIILDNDAVIIFPVDVHATSLWLDLINSRMNSKSTKPSLKPIVSQVLRITFIILNEINYSKGIVFITSQTILNESVVISIKFLQISESSFM